MWIKRLILPLLLAAAPAAALAQTTQGDENDFQTRLSLGLDKKLTKGVHLTLEEEFRFADGSSAIDRFQTALGLSYKVNPWLKAGVSYTLLNPYSTSRSSFREPRHRLSFDLTGSYKAGLWTFSLKERLQLTHRSGDFNTYQSNRNALVLKSRVSAKYKGFGAWAPYGFLEIRNTLNAPTVQAAYNSSKGTYSSTDGSTDPGWFISGWDGVYVNRMRLGLGAEYKISKQHSLDFFFLGDYVTDKEIDANKAGTTLKSYTIRHGLLATLGVGYTFSF